MEAEVLALKWNNHQSIFYHIICGLRTKGSYTDVTLACEGKFYPVHKLVLSTCSEYFTDIFDRTPCKNPVVVLKDIQCKDLEFLLDYMYIGEVNVKQNELSSLIKAAECLKVKGLAVRDDDPKSTSSGAKQRSGEHDRRHQSSPPPKRRRAEERRSSNPPASEYIPDSFTEDSRIEDEGNNTDTSVPAIGSDQVEPHGDQPLAHHAGDQEPSQEVENNVLAPMPEIKLEKDLEYEDNRNYEDEQYLPDEEQKNPKVETDETSEVMEEGVMGVNFSELLNSSLSNDDSIDPHSSMHPHVNLEQPWDGGAVARSLSTHNLPSTVGAHNPLSHHQQQKAAVAALGLLHSSGSESQSSLRLLQQQHGASANDPYTQQQNVMVGEGSLADYLQKKDRLQREYVCQFCGREFGHRTNLQAHLRIHTGEKPFHCLYCPYRTALKGNLKMHTISRHKADWKTIKHLVHPFAEENSS